MSKPKLLTCQDGQQRCWWCVADPLYEAYHDHEWGFPVRDDQRLFEKICLEGFQAGLSWLTILKKRDNFRQAFADFDYDAVARFRPARVEKLVKDPGIVRHRGKIESTINNAKQARKLVDEFGSLANFFWQFQPMTPGNPLAMPSQTTESQALSKELKRRGWSFVGPTTCYAFMQAMGLVNDHLPGCITRARVEKLSK